MIETPIVIKIYVKANIMNFPKIIKHLNLHNGTFSRV